MPADYVMYRKNYAEMIHNIVVPETISPNEKKKQFQPLIDYIHENTPEKLYRFRACNERNLSAFDKDELWFSSGYKMNDDFDGLLYFDKKRIKKEIETIKSEQFKNHFMLLGQGIGFPPEIQRMFAPQVLHNISNAISQLPSNIIDSSIEHFYNNVMTNFDANLSYISKLIQNVKIASLSATINSPAMWEHYADSGKGFAVSYDFRNGNYTSNNINNNCMPENLCYLAPMIYSNTRYDATEYTSWAFKQLLIERILTDCNALHMYNILQHIIPCPDTFTSTKALLHKASEWCPEKEWRLIFASNSLVMNQQEYVHVEKKPSGVYLGRNIRPIHEKILCSIAKDKNIPVYRMTINNNSRYYRLHDKRIM